VDESPQDSYLGLSDLRPLFQESN